jgi:hypothetical protein
MFPSQGGWSCSEQVVNIASVTQEQVSMRPCSQPALLRLCFNNGEKLIKGNQNFDVNAILEN